MSPDAMLVTSSQCLGQKRACMSGVWHVFCSLSSVATCVGHVWHREAVAPWPRPSWPVDLTQGSHRKIMRRNPMATEARETADLIGSDKVEGTTVYDAKGEKMGSIARVMIDKRSGQVAYAVLSCGGFLGIGNDYYPIPWAALSYDTSLGGYPGLSHKKIL